MLTKLLKYEFLSTGRIFLPLYLTLVGVSAILKLFITIERSIDLMIVPQVLFTLLYVVLIVAVFALVYILACMRFYRNLLGDEGYLARFVKTIRARTHKTHNLDCMDAGKHCGLYCRL